MILKETIGVLDSGFTIAGRGIHISMHRKYYSHEYQYEGEIKTLDYIEFWIENDQDVK